MRRSRRYAAQDLPGLRILATSREPLRVAGESSCRCPASPCPTPGASPPTEELAGYEAVRLFVERARAVDAGFELTEGERLRGGAALPEAGRHTAGHRARGGQVEGADGRADPRRSWRTPWGF